MSWSYFYRKITDKRSITFLDPVSLSKSFLYSFSMENNTFEYTPITVNKDGPFRAGLADTTTYTVKTEFEDLSILHEDADFFTEPSKLDFKPVQTGDCEFTVYVSRKKDAMDATPYKARFDITDRPHKTRTLKDTPPTGHIDFAKTYPTQRPVTDNDREFYAKYANYTKDATFLPPQVEKATYYVRGASRPIQEIVLEDKPSGSNAQEEEEKEIAI